MKKEDQAPFPTGTVVVFCISAFTFLWGVVLCFMGASTILATGTGYGTLTIGVVLVTFCAVVLVVFGMALVNWIREP